jgi:hypothetical protein
MEGYHAAALLPVLDVQARGGGAERLHASSRDTAAAAEVEGRERGHVAHSSQRLVCQQAAAEVERRERTEVARRPYALVRHPLRSREVQQLLLRCASSYP